MIPPALRKWLVETLNRLFIKKPKYFKYWQWVSIALMSICGIPYMLVQFSVSLPDWLQVLSNKFVSGASIAMLIMSQLTVKPPDQPQPVNPEKMPFTDTENKKQELTQGIERDIKKIEKDEVK